MARYFRDFIVDDEADEMFAEVNSYLTSVEGYNYTEIAGEKMFEKGFGVMPVPSFVKITFYGNRCRLEAWLTKTISGIYTTEMGLDGFVEGAAKKILADRVGYVESIIRKYGKDAPPPVMYQQQPQYQQPQYQQPQYQQPMYQQPQYQQPAYQQNPYARNAGVVYCPGCRKANSPDAEICIACGRPLKLRRY